MEEEKTGIFGTEYYYCDILCSKNIRAKWWLKFIPRFVARFIQTKFYNPK